MKQVGKMSILEHIAMAMEDLEQENILDNPERAKLAIEKARSITDLAATYTNVIKTDQDEKRLMIEAMDVAGKWNYNKTELKQILQIEEK